jgi:hypothetical protein
LYVYYFYTIFIAQQTNYDIYVLYYLSIFSIVFVSFFAARWCLELGARLVSKEISTFL